VRDLTVSATEPRIADLVLGTQLGFDRSRNVRALIRRNIGELTRHGAISLHREAKIAGRGRGRPEEGFLLNEGQALVVCMLSRTDRAVEVREQVIKVFMAWRHGQTLPASRSEAVPVAAGPTTTDPYALAASRAEFLGRLTAQEPSLQTREFALAVAALPLGRKARRQPKFWGDIDVRHAAVALYRQSTVDDALRTLAASFGPERVPSRSALHRFWKRLDQVRCVGHA
jgi:hypothetical protein